MIHSDRPSTDEATDGWSVDSAAQLRGFLAEGMGVLNRAIEQRYRQAQEQAYGIARGAFKHISEFLTLRCAPDLMALGVYPNAKELTESMAAYRAVRNFMQRDWPLDDPEVVAVFPGDGCTPRTAALFAMRTAWRCISVDPKLKRKERYAVVRRLELVSGRIEELGLATDRALVVGVHAHVRPEQVLAGVRARKLGVVMMPCCVKWEPVPALPDEEYEDRGVLSPKCTVMVWREWPQEQAQ